MCTNGFKINIKKINAIRSSKKFIAKPEAYRHIF